MKNRVLPIPLVYTIIFVISMMTITVLIASKLTIMIILLYPFWSSAWTDTLIHEKINRDIKYHILFIQMFALLAALIMTSILRFM